MAKNGQIRRPCPDPGPGPAPAPEPAPGPDPAVYLIGQCTIRLCTAVSVPAGNGRCHRRATRRPIHQWALNNRMGACHRRNGDYYYYYYLSTRDTPIQQAMCYIHVNACRSIIAASLCNKTFMAYLSLDSIHLASCSSIPIFLY